MALLAMPVLWLAFLLPAAVGALDPAIDATEKASACYQCLLNACGAAWGAGPASCNGCCTANLAVLLGSGCKCSQGDFQAFCSKAPVPTPPDPAPTPPAPTPTPTPPGSFPITILEISQADFDQLSSDATPAAQKDALGTSLLMPQMRDLFRKPEFAITIEVGDVVITAGPYPKSRVVDTCEAKVDAEHPMAKGIIEHGSTLSFGVAKVDWKSLTVFADAEVDAVLDIDLGVKVQAGVEAFGSCKGLGQRTVGINVLSDGHTGIALTMTASGAHIAKVHNVWSIVFNLQADVYGKVISWNVDKVTAANCQVKIFNIEIIFVCGMLEKYIKQAAQDLTDVAEVIVAPILLQKLTNKINTAIGGQVVIPLKLPFLESTAEVDAIVV